MHKNLMLFVLPLVLACGGGSSSTGGDPGGSDVVSDVVIPVADAPDAVSTDRAGAGDGEEADVLLADGVVDTTVADPGSEDTSGDDVSPGDVTDVPPDSPPLDDALDAADDASVSDGYDATDTALPPDAWVQPTVFDLAMIRDPSTAACTFESTGTTLKDGVLVDTWRVSYTSWESIDGVLHPIRIRAFAARPAAASGKLPGVVHAHGLGGLANEENATGPAALIDAFVIAYTGPGGGDSPENTSEGLPAMYDEGRRLFDTIPDVRGSWFWGHAVAAMRAATCLETRDEVDASRLGITGFSAGGVISLMSAGVDDRFDVAVPLSGTGAWGVAVQSPDAWQHGLLKAAGYDTTSPQWTTLLATIGADVLVAGAKGRVFMVDGSSDEFFPLTAFMATYDKVPGEKRLGIAANFDHGCYGVTGVEKASDIEERATLHANGVQRAWMRYVFGTDSDYAYFPALPVAQAQAVGGGTVVSAVVDGGGAKLAIDKVEAWFSTDDCFLFGKVDMDETGGTVYTAILPLTLPANAVWYVDVTYKTAGLFPQRFALSSLPVVPAGLVPHIRGMDSCL